MRSGVYEALAHQAARHGIVFHSDHLVYPAVDGAATTIYYRDISRIITTSLYIGVMQTNGFLHIFLRDSGKKVFIDLHEDDTRGMPLEKISPQQIEANINRELDEILARHTNGAE